MFDVSPHKLTSEWIVMTDARVFHNNERTPSFKMEQAAEN